MKAEFTIRVDLGVTRELSELVYTILGACHGKRQEPDNEPTPAPSAESPVEPEPPVEPVPTVEVAVSAPEPPVEPVPTVEVAVSAPEPPAEPAEPAAPRELTEQDVRDAMHRARLRIEGENYKNEADGDAYKRYHKPLTALFKKMALSLGSDKPSALPADKRAQFIEECDTLSVGSDGEIQQELPF